MTSYKPRSIEHLDVETRARQSQGASSCAIYEMVARTIAGRYTSGDVLVDIGCGTGNLWQLMGVSIANRQEDYCAKPKGEYLEAHRYIGVDAIRYDGFPAEAQFIPCDLNASKVPLADACTNVTCAVEMIEHLENPRAFVRELVRLTKPGGWVIVTTPNQLSLLSKITLVLKNQFNAFQESRGLYPAHITALLEIDLIRIFTECGLTNIEIDFTNQGRIPFTSWHWPKSLGFRGRTFSDNILCLGLKAKN